MLVDFSSLYSGVDAELIRTGIVPLDVVLGGGYERGDWIQVASESGGGKSTMLLYMCKKAIQQGLRICWIDAERGVKRKILTTMGLIDYVGSKAGESKFLLVNPPSMSFEDLVKVFNTVATGPEETRYDLIIIDSFSAVTVRGKGDDNDDIFGGPLGTRAIHQQKFLEYFKGRCAGNGVTVWAIHQKRMQSEKTARGLNFFEEAEGANSSKHMPDIRLWMDIGKALVRKEETVVGMSDKVQYGVISHLKCRKNRNERPNIPVDMYVIFGQGISNPLSLEVIMRGKGLLSGPKPGSGAWEFTELADNPVFSGQKGRGAPDLWRFLGANEDAIVEYLWNHGYLRLTGSPQMSPVDESDDSWADDNEE